jgi:hypothetical protein
MFFSTFRLDVEGDDHDRLALGNQGFCFFRRDRPRVRQLGDDLLVFGKMGEVLRRLDGEQDEGTPIV